jgi:hypothetical protein
MTRVVLVRMAGFRFEFRFRFWRISMGITMTVDVNRLRWNFSVPEEWFQIL